MIFRRMFHSLIILIICCHALRYSHATSLCSLRSAFFCASPPLRWLPLFFFRMSSLWLGSYVVGGRYIITLPLLPPDITPAGSPVEGERLECSILAYRPPGRGWFSAATPRHAISRQLCCRALMLSLDDTPWYFRDYYAERPLRCLYADDAFFAISRHRPHLLYHLQQYAASHFISPCLLRHFAAISFSDATPYYYFSVITLLPDIDILFRLLSFIIAITLSLILRRWDVFADVSMPPHDITSLRYFPRPLFRYLRFDISIWCHYCLRHYWYFFFIIAINGLSLYFYIYALCCSCGQLVLCIEAAIEPLILPWVTTLMLLSIIDTLRCYYDIIADFPGDYYISFRCHIDAIIDYCAFFAVFTLIFDTIFITPLFDFRQRHYSGHFFFFFHALFFHFISSRRRHTTSTPLPPLPPSPPIFSRHCAATTTLGRWYGTTGKVLFSLSLFRFRRLISDAIFAFATIFFGAIIDTLLPVIVDFIIAIAIIYCVAFIDDIDILTLRYDAAATRSVYAIFRLFIAITSLIFLYLLIRGCHLYYLLPLIAHDYFSSLFQRHCEAIELMFHTPLLIISFFLMHYYHAASAIIFAAFDDHFTLSLRHARRRHYATEHYCCFHYLFSITPYFLDYRQASIHDYCHYFDFRFAFSLPATASDADTLLLIIGLRLFFSPLAALSMPLSLIPPLPPLAFRSFHCLRQLPFSHVIRSTHNRQPAPCMALFAVQDTMQQAARVWQAQRQHGVFNQKITRHHECYRRHARESSAGAH